MYLNIDSSVTWALSYILKSLRSWIIITECKTFLINHQTAVEYRLVLSCSCLTVCWHLQYTHAFSSGWIFEDLVCVVSKGLVAHQSEENASINGLWQLDQAFKMHLISKRHLIRKIWKFDVSFCKRINSYSKAWKVKCFDET